jgi:alpha-L-fucosidase 2
MLLAAIAATALQFAPTLNPSTDLLFLAPAKVFTESCPVGNGRLGAMFFGDPNRERVVLNESGMWSGSPQDADRENAHLVLPEIRRLLLADENRKAQDLLQKNFICKGPGSGGGSSKDGPYGCYQVFGMMEIDAPGGSATRYRRDLDLDQAICKVQYTQDGVDFKREGFASAPNQVVVYHYSASRPGALAFAIKLSRPENATVSIEGDDLILKGRLKSGNPAYAGVSYEGRVRVVTDGKVRIHGDSLIVNGGEQATILFSGGTSLNDSQYRLHALQNVDNASKLSYPELREQHVHEYQSFFHRVSIGLPEGPSAKHPLIDRLVATAKGEDDPSLGALYFNFGRYLLISSSRPNSPLPANLQGIWAEELATPWNGDFHLDINVQMNYWPAEICGLSDCHLPLLRFIQTLVPNGEKTAKAYYAARGWVAHVITNPWKFTSPGEGADWGSTSSGGGWLCEHLWNHYAYTHDLAYLKSVYPVMKGASQFFLDMLIKEPKHGWLVTSPSNSPENQFIHPKDGPVSTCMGPTMDETIVRELFTNTIRSAQILKLDPQFVTRLKMARADLAPFQIAKFGQIQEWLEDYQETDVHHRHASPLYGLFPGVQIDPEATPKLAAAARVTLERRGDLGTGWSLAWKVAFWANLWDGDHAWKLVKRLLRPITFQGYDNSDGGGTYPNLFDACPPYQIDGNFGATAGIAQMLLQAKDGEIRLLPALPKSWASAGFVKGLKAPGNVTVDIEWKNGKIIHYSVRGPGADAYRIVSGIPVRAVS